MSIDENKAIVRRFFANAWNQNKTSDLEEYISADRIHHFGAKPLKHSTDGLRAMIKNWRGAMPDYHAHIEDMIAGGDRVVVILRFTGTQTGNLKSLRAYWNQQTVKLTNRKFWSSV